VKIKGSRQLRARLHAIPKKAPARIGRAWAQETARAARPMVPVRTGALRRSIRVGRTSAGGATVVANRTAFFVDRGTRPHDITPKRKKGLVFQGKKGTIFARKVHHRGTRAKPFRARAARMGLRRADMERQVIAVWNEAA
jgi:hypothetical protein